MRCETAEHCPFLLDGFLHEPFHVLFGKVLVFGIGRDGHPLSTDADIVSLRTCGCYKETALVVGNRIRFSVHDTREESEIIHRHSDFPCGVGIQCLRPIVVRCVRRCELEQVGVEVKCFRSIFRVDISVNLEVFSITISTTKTPHYLLEAHRDAVVFFAIPSCDAVEVLRRARKEFGNIAKLVVRCRGCECVAVLLLERRHLFWIFK